MGQLVLFHTALHYNHNHFEIMGKTFTQTQKAVCFRGRTLYSLISFWQVGDSSRQAYSTINPHKAVAGCYSLFAKSFPSVPTAPTFFRASSMRLKKTARTLILQLVTSLVPFPTSVSNQSSPVLPSAKIVSKNVC